MMLARWLPAEVPVSPDGVRYLAAGSGVRVCRPFHFRWLIPAVCRDRPSRYVVATSASLAGLPFAEWWLSGSWRAGLLVFGLSGVWSFNRRFPVLVDAPALLLAMLAAAAWAHGAWWAALPLVLVAGAVKETSPVFSALFVWQPWLLVGLAGPLVRSFMRAGPDVLPPGTLAALAVRHPVRAALARAGLSSPLRWLTPWGVCLAGLYGASPRLLLVVAVAYAQCLFATDDARLYQWAWPVLALAAVNVIPSAWWWLALAAHLCNPWKGQGA